MPTEYYHHIRRKFVCSVTVVLMLLAGVFYWHSSREYRYVIAGAETRSASYVSALKEHAERVFAEADNTLKEMIEEIEENGGLSFSQSPQFYKLLSERAKSGPQFSSIYVVDTRADIIAHSLEYKMKPVNLADRDYFLHHRDNPASALFISKPFKSKVSNTWRFSLSRPLRDAKGRFAGLISVTFETGYFEKFYKNIDVGNNGRVILATAGGDILVHEPSSEKALSTDFKGDSFFAKYLSASRSGTFNVEKSAISQNSLIISFSHLSSFPLVSIVSLDRAEVVAPWLAHIYNQIFLGFLLVLLIAVLSTLFLRQVRKLERANLQLELQHEELELKAELLDSASDAILLLDENGYLVQFNNALCSISGRSRQELEATKIQDIEPPEYADKVVDNIRRLFEIENAVFESAYVHASGTVIPVEVHARPVVIGQRKLVLSIVRDISERKEASSRIMSTIKEWQGTFDAVEDVVWLLDADRRVVRANASTQRVFGRSAREIVGLDCCQAAHSDQLPHHACPFDLMVKTKKRASMQMNIADRSYEVSVDPVFSENGTITNAVHIVKDITDLKKAELHERIRSEILERISRNESLVQLLSFIAVSIEKLIHGALCSILLVDEAGKRLLNGAAPHLPDFYNMAVNRTRIAEGSGSCGTAAFRRERVVVEDIDSHPFWKGFTPAAEAGLRSCWSEPIVSSSGVLLGTFAIYHREPATPDEYEIRVIEQAALFAGLAIEHSRADRELRSSEERYRTLVDNLPVVVWEADASSATTFISRQVEQVYGFTQEEMYAAGPDLWFERIHEEDQKRVTDAYKAFFSGKSVFDEEYRIMRKDGEWVWLHDVAYAITAHNDKKVAYGIFADITARRKAEQERDELEQQLSQSQKMEAIGHLSGGIAHDFNNLLTPIIIYADMLKRSLPADEKMHYKIDGVIKASHKARDLTQQLLGFGRKQVMQMQTVDLNAVITSFNSIIRRTLRENIDIDLRLSPQSLLIRADCSKLDQVVLNLAINAQDAISETGLITIETGHVMVDDEFARLHPGIHVGAYALLDFRDSGCGMSEETMQHIFEPFFTTKQVGHGTGLGLANVYGVIKQHRGYISVQSKVGSGTSFRMFFPLTDQKADGAQQSGDGADAEHTGTGNILLVEDNEMVRTMTRDLLEGLGYTVHTADHPDLALEIAGQKSLNIDLVITDVVMPGMNGKQLFERIKTDRPEINKVLYMSGYTNNIIVTEGVLEDGLNFLQKPFTIDVLMAKVKELLH